MKCVHILISKKVKSRKPQINGVLHWIEKPSCFPAMVTSLTVALSCVLVAISLIREGSKERKVFEAEIAALGGPDALMSEVYYETLYVLSRFGKPHTIITRRC